MTDKVVELPPLGARSWNIDREGKQQDEFWDGLYSSIDARMRAGGSEKGDEYLAAAMLWSTGCIEATYSSLDWRELTADSIEEKDKLLRPVCDKLLVGGELDPKDKRVLETELTRLAKRVDGFLDPKYPSSEEEKFAQQSKRVDWIAQVLGIKVNRQKFNSPKAPILDEVAKNGKETPQGPELDYRDKEEITYFVKLIEEVSDPDNKNQRLSFWDLEIGRLLDSRISRLKRNRSKSEVLDKEKSRRVEIFKQTKLNQVNKLIELVREEFDWILGIDSSKMEEIEGLSEVIKEDGVFYDTAMNNLQARIKSN